MMYNNSYGYRKKRRYNKFWTSSKISQALYEYRNQGIDYLKTKYGSDRVQEIVGKLERVTRAPGREKAPKGVTLANAQQKAPVRYVKGRGMVKVGWSGLNAPPKVDASKYAADKNVKAGGRFGDGGPPDPSTLPPTDGTPPFPGGTFKPRMQLNLENDEELAQGHQTPWAQPTSISSTITSLLRQAQNASSNYWDQWALDKGGQYALDSRGSSDMGVDLRWTPNSPPPATQAPSQRLAQTSPMGAFSTNTVMSAAMGPNGAMFPTQPMPAPQFQSGADNTDTTDNTDDPGIPDPIDKDHVVNIPPDTDMLGYDPTNQVYNPWGRLQGGERNDIGPDSTRMANSTLEALSLANAYFAPQRMELAYELGDMETDMRRLAVNLGRQVDDPVLQAKLYKEGMRAVRTLDVQQNTFAFQMAEQRRKEELSNYQFYDQLAQEEARLRLQNRQFYENLDLQRQYFNLDRSNIILNRPDTPGTTTPPAPTTGGSSAPMLNNPFIQKQYPNPTGSAFTGAPSVQSLYSSLLNSNPYGSSMGGGNLVRSTYPF